MTLDEVLSISPSAFYVFDTAGASARIEYIRSVLGSDLKYAYAVKANPFLTEALASHADRFEICSPGESAICDECGIPQEKTVISGVYKTPSFIDALAASDAGRVYTVESNNQFELLRTLSAKYGKPLSLLLRLTNGSQFGINERDIERIISEREAYPQLNILGLQFFSGTQKNSLKKLRREISQLDAFITRLYECFGFITGELEFGTGFPVPYFAGEEFNEETFFSDFRDILESMTNSPVITLELGRSAAAFCGKYYTHIVDMKNNCGQNYLLIDGGMHQLVYFGQFMGMKLPPVTVLGKETDPSVAEWNICGSLCSMNDIVVKQLPLPEVKTGDILCFERTGAYSMTEGIALFLSRELPAVYLSGENGELTLVREAVETYPFNSPHIKK